MQTTFKAGVWLAVMIMNTDDVILPHIARGTVKGRKFVECNPLLQIQTIVM